MGVKKFSCIYIVSMLLVSVFGFGFNSGPSEMSYFMEGEGTEENPYVITNLEELQNISKDMNADYILGNDINADSTKDWNEGKGFKPIRNFTGSLDGQGYKITDLYINRSTSDRVGLIGIMMANSTVKNVRVENANIQGNRSVASLVGFNYGGVVENCSSSGTVMGKSFIGGLLGTNLGLVENSSASGTIESTVLNVGGLVGGNRGVISNSYFNGTVDGNVSIGGLVGWNKRTVKDSHASGEVTGNRVVGGLVAHNYIYNSSVKNSHSDVNVNGSRYVSGLVGWNDRGNVENCQAYGQADGYKNVSGLVGWNRGRVSGSKAMGNVNGVINVGGIVGWNEKIIENSASTVTVNGDENVGGFVGTSNGTILSSYSTGNVTGNDTVGGFVGWNYVAAINNSFSRGNVNGVVDVGGFVGWNSKSKYGINKSYSTGVVNGDENYGGFCGTNLGKIYNSFWDNQTSGLTNSEGGIGKETSEMKDVYTYTNTSTLGLYDPWDFVADPYEDENDEDIWNIDDEEVINDGYPFLSWDVTKVEIYPSEDQTITAGETLNFTAEAYTSEDNLITNVTSMFKWENTTANGTFNNTTAGDYSVAAIYEGVTSEVVSVTVEPANVSDVEISPFEDKVINAGEMIAFNAWANDTYGNIVTDNITEFIWQNTTDGGIFEKTTIGTYEVMASYGAYSSKVVDITVEISEVSVVKISPDIDQTVTAGETIDFDAEAYDDYENLITDTDSNFTWNNTDDEGVFSKTTEGNYTVYAEYEGVTSSFINVTVEVSEVSSVEISPIDNQTVTAGDEIDFDAVAYDDHGNILTENDTDFIWENTDVEGMFKNTTAGLYNVTAVYEGVASNVVTVTVEEGSVYTVEISPVENQTITAGESVDFDAAAYDEYNNLITDDDGEFDWKNTSSEGIFSFTETGNYVVTAYYGEVISSHVNVTVSAGEVATVEIAPSDQQTVTAGEEIDFDAAAYDDHGNLITDVDSEFDWENTDLEGVFSSTSVGEYVVTAEYSGITSDQVSVSVEHSQVDSVEIICLDEQTIKAGENVNFAAWANDSYGNTITTDNADFSWDNTDDNGQFTLTTVGDYDVTAAYEGVSSDPIMITVEAGEVATVEIAPSGETSISAGATLEFRAWANDSYGNTVTSEDNDFTWDNAGEDGVFEESEPGEYVVFAGYEDVDSESVTVSVKGAMFKFSNLRINPEKALVGEEITLMIDVTNEGNEAGEYSVEFHIDGEKIGSDTVEVDAGATETVSMDYEVEKKGSHTLEAAGESMTVNAEENVDDDGEKGLSLLSWGIIILIAVLLVILAMLIINRSTEPKEESEKEEDNIDESSEESEDFFEDDEDY